MDATASSICAPGSTHRALRARTQLGVCDNPSLELLRRLVFGLGPGNPYLVIDRLDAPDGDYYAQALHRPDGTWIVEYRDGGRNRHYQADASGPGVVYQLLAGWTLELPGWQRRLTWRPIFQ
jgi:hypothetical protein